MLFMLYRIQCPAFYLGSMICNPYVVENPFTWYIVLMLYRIFCPSLVRPPQSFESCTWKTGVLGKPGYLEAGSSLYRGFWVAVKELILVTTRIWICSK